MRQHEIECGGHYYAKVNGKITVVRVDSIRETHNGKRAGVVYYVTNTRTGRSTTFRSATKFRSVGPKIS